MAQLILPSRFNQQPQQPAPLDLSNSLTRGLAYAWIPANSTLLRSGNPILSVNSGGVATRTSGDASGFLYAFSSPAFDINEVSVSALLTPTNTSIAGAWAIGGGSNPDNGQLLLLGQSDNAALGFATRGASNNFYSTSGAISTWSNGVTSLVTGVRSSRAGTQKVYCRGVQAGSAPVGTDSATVFNRFSIGGVLRDSFSAGWAGAVGLVLIHNRALSPLEVATLAENPWQVFKAPPRRLWAVPAVPVDTTLVGSATAQAAASGSLTSLIRLDGAATAVTSASGFVTTAVRMTGVSSATAAASGTLSTAVQLAGAVSGQASASGSLGTQIKLTGPASAGASASGALATGILLSGTAIVSATASGTLAGGPTQFSGAAVASATGSGALSTNISLAGVASAQASVSGSFGTAGAMLSGAAVATGSASGALLTTIRMTGLAQASASASGALGGTAAQLSGVAAASTGAAGSLATAIRLTGTSAAQATASGVLAGSNIVIPSVPASRTVNFAGGVNRVDFAGGTNRVNFDGGKNRVDFGGGTTKVDF